MCVEKNWYLGGIVDQCAPAQPYPVPGQQVYIKDEQVKPPKCLFVDCPNTHPSELLHQPSKP
ncbi:hypothetical protein BCR33DRAFT_712769 [Rhizoclosmatium globosum]|uniref:Uncharacterized protein n=1 Tax=Rhizoclosmatium globosum TaxID=329046 RepID=A0A1Y2CUZ8_9FUNG|nr:hypothetical protein BCR33DRAFT_712769 [Rhizoclosmatium globosum]|eukprot:ORY50787.1 hypothetical protein BCR33DRAFT_712769 [Rhizoclosmatium globosum]